MAVKLFYSFELSLESSSELRSYTPEEGLGADKVSSSKLISIELLGRRQSLI